MTVPQFAAAVGLSDYIIRKWVKQGRVRAIDTNPDGIRPVFRIPRVELKRIAISNQVGIGVEVVKAGA
jgi:hypothetical protein